MIHVIGGVYHEKCLSPSFTQFYGSGGRAAAALASTGKKVKLHAFVYPGDQPQAKRLARLSDFELCEVFSEYSVTFGYISPMHSPLVDPPAVWNPGSLRLDAKGEVALVFGIYEGSTHIDAETVVYDPQNSNTPIFFSQTGGTCRRLAIVCNEREARSLARSEKGDPGALIQKSENAEVVVVKRGAAGATVYTEDGSRNVSAYRSDTVFAIGSGDIFAAAFTEAWACLGLDPWAAADWASRAVCSYVHTHQEGFPNPEARASMKEVNVSKGTVYLAGPFFNMSQRWLIEHTRTVLESLGMSVFSPLHEVGFGSAEEVATEDLIGLEQCDRVFAIIDGLDAGTIFEIGYARKMGLPVYAYSELVGSEDCKMIAGSGCKVLDDYTTAIYHTAWKI